MTQKLSLQHRKKRQTIFKTQNVRLKKNIRINLKPQKYFLIRCYPEGKALTLRKISSKLQKFEKAMEKHSQTFLLWTIYQAGQKIANCT